RSKADQKQIKSGSLRIVVRSAAATKSCVDTHGYRGQAPSHIGFHCDNWICVSKVFAARNFHIPSKTICRLYPLAKALTATLLKVGAWYTFSN
ncbi:hypothetical protein, partial [Pseudomonas paralactis]|uniref:hypothetical protein n=1 Tax=Pseudomonas paralactis TaxID=1615673 RepID=UPI0034D5FB76